MHKVEWTSWTQHLHSEEGQKEIAKVKELTKIAEQGEGNLYAPRAHGLLLTRGLQTYSAA